MWFTTSTWLNIYWIWNTTHLSRLCEREHQRQRERKIESERWEGRESESGGCNFRALPFKYGDSFSLAIHSPDEFLIVIILCLLPNVWVCVCVLVHTEREREQSINGLCNAIEFMLGKICTCNRFDSPVARRIPNTRSLLLLFLLFMKHENDFMEWKK